MPPFCILSLSEPQCKIVHTFTISQNRCVHRPSSGRKNHLFLLLCLHVPSSPYPHVTFTYVSLIEVDGALRSSTVAESPLVFSSRRSNATCDAAGNQYPPAFRGPLGRQLGLSHVLQTDGIVLSGGECTHEKPPGDVAGIRNAFRGPFHSRYYTGIARCLSSSRGIR